MQYTAIVLLVIVAAFTSVAKAEDRAITYYVQLIRGTDSDQPPQAGSRRVGQKLREDFDRVFKSKNYWEICQRKLEVVPGRASRLHLGQEREIEIDLSRPGKRTIAAFRNGKFVDRMCVPMSDAVTLMGGDRDEKSVWFFAVRRDKPLE